MRFTKVILLVLGVVSLMMSTNLHAKTVSNGVIAYPCLSPPSPENICYINVDGTGMVQVTFNAINGLPWWSPDGTRLAFTNIDFKIGPNIVVMNADGSNQHSITAELQAKGLDAVGPAWSPDGKQIAFASSITGNAEIWTIHPDGTNLRRVTNAPGEKRLPVWSPDGKSIAYQQADATGHEAIWVIGVPDSSSLGKNPRQLTNGMCNKSACENVDADQNFINFAIDAATPAWGPNNTIIFWSGVEHTTGQIWIMDADGKNRKQLIKPTKTELGDYPNDDDPEWSPDGKFILFSTNRHIVDRFHVPELWVMKANGTDQTFITEVSAAMTPGDAAWQPVPKGNDDGGDD